jgi:hypothetical protein
MNTYTFDLKLFASISVKANNVIEAREQLEGKLDCASVNFGAFDDGSPILGEASLDDEETLDFFEAYDAAGEPIEG